MRPALPGRRGKPQDGYILLTVLALLVVLVLLAAAAATAANRVRADQQRDDARLAGELDAHSTRATLLYLLATQRMTFAGLTVDDRVVYTPSELREKQRGEIVHALSPVGNELRMNGAEYTGLGSSRFALRPRNGTFNINLQPVMRRAWLARLQVPPGDRSILEETLLDYQDPDDAPHLNGAEHDRYRQQGLPPPPDRSLFTPLELRGVMGWGKALESVDDAQLLRTFTVARSGRVDINAAPAEVLALLPGVTRAMAERVVALRNASAITDIATAYALLPTLDQDDQQITMYPSNSGTLRVWPDASSGATLTDFTLTPFDDGGSPWHIDFEIRLPAREDGRDATARQPRTPLLGHPQAAHP